MKLIDSVRGWLFRLLMRLAKNQLRAGLQKEIRQAERRRNDLAGQLLELGTPTEPAPSDHPLRKAISEEEEKIRQLHERLAKVQEN
jgi:DNA-directed RNA polymerase specialized sigma24 family protein